MILVLATYSLIFTIFQLSRVEFQTSRDTGIVLSLNRILITMNRKLVKDVGIKDIPGGYVGRGTAGTDKDTVFCTQRIPVPLDT